MYSTKKRELILRLDQLIRMKVCGNASALAKRLNISRSTFFRLLDDMKYNLDAPISYCECNRRYQYEREGCIKFGFVSYEELKENELTQTGGGYFKYSTSVINNKLYPVSFFETPKHQFYQRFN